MTLPEIIESDTFTHKDYPGLTVTTTRDSFGKVRLRIKGQDLADCHAVEAIMLAALDSIGAKAENRQEHSL